MKARWNKLAQAGTNIFTAGVVVYTVLVLGLVILRFVGASFWVFTMAFAFMLLWFVPLVVLVPLAFVWRSRQVRIATAVLSVLFVGMFWRQLLPPQSRAVAQQPQRVIRVATMNHWMGNTDYDGLVEKIREIDADLVFIQEVTPVSATVFDGRLTEEYPYRWWLSMNVSRSFTQMVLSKYPLHDPQQVQRAPILQMMVDLGDREFMFMGVHLRAPRVVRECEEPVAICLPHYSSASRDYDYPTLFAALEQVDEPLVVAGDFNTSDTEHWYNALAMQLQDAYAETNWGFGFTFPVAHPENQWSLFPSRLVRIDYVWTKGGVEPVRSWIDCSVPVTDHCAMIAELSIPEGDSALRP